MSSGRPEDIFGYAHISGMNNKKHLIKTDSISYSYPLDAETEGEAPAVGPKALENVSLEVEKGQFICILGSNGSGKSTLARHLNALLVPDGGTVWIGGMDTKEDQYLWDIRADVGMVFQNPDNQLVASQVDEEVAFGPENIGVPSKEIRERVKRALEYTGLSGYEKENPGLLSGGQKQRVAVAGILAMQPDCIVLDESTAMLDPKGRQEIMDTVLDLNHRYQITIICITHFMEEAVRADRVFVMHKGKVLLSGTPREVFRSREEIQAAGLKLPVICRIVQDLRNRGMQIPEDIITQEELVQFLKELA